METTIRHAGNTSPNTRRPQHSRTEVVSTVLRCLGLGYDYAATADVLGMSRDPKGALRMALRRAGRQDLLDALRGGLYYPPPELTREIAESMLAELPPEHPAAVEQRRRDLLAEVYDTDEDETPRGRRVKGAGGIWKWVAA